MRLAPAALAILVGLGLAPRGSAVEPQRHGQESFLLRAVFAEGRLWLLGRVKRRLVRDGTTWWPLPAELAALAEPGVRHAAYLPIVSASGGSRAVLCVEPVGVDAAALERRLAPWPVDEVVALPRIPRDPRHASKTDAETLSRHLLGRSARR